MLVHLDNKLKIEVTAESLTIYDRGGLSGRLTQLYHSELSELPIVDFEVTKKGIMTEDYKFKFGSQEVLAKGKSGMSNSVKYYLALAILAKCGDEEAIEKVSRDETTNPFVAMSTSWDMARHSNTLWDRARRTQKEYKPAKQRPAAPAAKQVTAKPAPAPAPVPTPKAPRAATPPPPPAAAVFRFHAMIDGKQQGPYDEAQFGRLVNFGVVTRETFVWCDGMAEWKPAGEVDRLQKLMGTVPPPMPGM